MSLAAYGSGGAKALEEKARQRSLGVEVLINLQSYRSTSRIIS